MVKTQKMVTLDDEIVQEIKTRGFALSSFLNNLAVDKLGKLKAQEEVTPQEIGAALAKLKERHGDKNPHQLQILMEVVQNAVDMPYRDRTITSLALKQLKEQKEQEE